jgi:putative SOS response-associated peptidase YedK
VLFERAGGAPFCFAGIWSWWRPTAADPYERTFSILTTRAWPPVDRLHDRGPVVVEPEDYLRWLQGPEPAALLHGPPEGSFAGRRVSDVVNNVRNEGPACDEPPGDLFGARW